VIVGSPGPPSGGGPGPDRMVVDGKSPSAVDWRRHGGVVMIAGPDGVGKTTLHEALAAEVLADVPVMLVHHRQGLLPGRKMRGSGTEPHRHPPYPAFLSLLKLVYLFADFRLGWALRIRPFVRRGGWVVLQRNWWDLSVDPLRYRLRPHRRVARFLGSLLPKPDLTLVLEAPVAVITARKEELPGEELQRQMNRWRHLLGGADRCVFLDASDPLPVVVARAEHQLRQQMEALAVAREGFGWAHLPVRASSRWVLPRGPRRAVATALRIYQPVTPWGFCGWWAARLAAGMGLFRLLPRGDGPPPALRELIGPLQPPGGAIAVVRSNHPERYVAMILGRDGEAVAVAKISTASSGNAVLEREGRAILDIGSQLGRPLAAPAVRSLRPGLLLLDPIPSRTRARAWRLPEEVADALGRFFRAGGHGGPPAVGPAHGDFAPWNLLRMDDGWVAVDWESATWTSPPFHDLFHYLFQAHHLLGRPRRRTLLAGLEGAGWVGGAIASYANAASLSPRHAPRYFAVYLEGRIRECDDTPKGRKDIAIMQRFLEDLGEKARSATDG
jgi:thymidylate kinase